MKTLICPYCKRKGLVKFGKAWVGCGVHKQRYVCWKGCMRTTTKPILKINKKEGVK